MTEKLRPYLLGAAFALVGLLTFEAVRHIYKSEPASQQAKVHQIQGFPVNPSWILEGQPNFKATEFFHSSDGRVVSGIFECDPSKFEWHYSLDEAIFILDGEVEISYQGKQFTLHTGESAFFRAGTVATWKVKRHIRKTWTLYDPGKTARALAQIVN